MNDERNYISPKSIGYIELTPQEKQKIKNVNEEDSEKPVDVIIAFLFIVISIPLNSHKNIVFDVILIILFLAYLSIRLICHFSNNINYKAASYGTVVDKEVIYQEISIKSDQKLKPYNRDGVERTSSMKKKAFYYLIVKLDTGEYVRYVNCIDKDFDCLEQGNKVLVVYYGGEKICGYSLN